MQKHSIRFFAAFFLFLSVGQVSAQMWQVDGQFDTAFSYLAERRVIRSDQGNLFTGISRIDALKVLIDLQPKLHERAVWFASHMPPLPLYQDIDQHAWYAPYVEAGFEAGIVMGYPDHLFHPGRPLRAEEAIVLVQRAYGQETGQTDGTWYDAAARKAFALNIVPSSQRLHLGDLLMRGQFFDIVYRMDVLSTQHLTAFANSAATSSVTVPVPVLLVPSSSSSVPVYVPTVVSSVSSVAVVPSSSAAPVVTAVQPSAKSFAISIPALDIKDLTVTHPADPTTSKGLLSVLTEGVGHLFSYPGGNGKIMIYGHSSGYPWDVSKYTKIFRTVNKLEAGDDVYVTYQGKVRTYKVSYKETVDAGDMKPFSGQGEELILYTCWPPDSIKQRYLVHAVPVSSDVAGR